MGIPSTIAGLTDSSFSPSGEIDSAGERGHHDELREGDVRFFGHLGGGGEGVGTVGWETEDEGTQDVNAVFAEGLETAGQIVAGQVKIFEDGFQAFFGDGLHADKRPADSGTFHGVEEFDVFSGLHGDLREEHHVVRKGGEAFHEDKTFVADGFELGDLFWVTLLTGQAKVGVGDWVKVVVRQGDEPKALAAELDDFLDDAVGRTLAGLLAVGPPDRAEAAVFGAAADGLHGGPHVAVLRHQVPAGGDELVGIDSATVVNGDGECR